MLVLRLAWRNLFRNTRRTVLTGLLLSLSLTALILTNGLVLGMVELMVGSVTKTLAGEAQIHRRGYLDDFDAELFLDNIDDITAYLDAAPDVAEYAPRIMTGAIVTSSYNVSAGLVYGVDPVRELGVSRLADALVEGEYLSGGRREIMIGTEMASLLEVSLGDRIVITASHARSGEISQDLYRVSGIFQFGLTEMDEAMAFINLDAARELVGLADGAHQIAVQFTDPELAKNREHPLYQELSTEAVEALSWLDFNPQIAGVIEWSNYSTIIIGVVLFFLASIGVVNSMFMSIYERFYEFGVIKAVGTTPGAILRLVLLEALLIAIASCVAGNLLGYLASGYFQQNGIPFGRMEMSGVVIEKVYTRLALTQFTAYPVYITLLTLTAALYPALFAARITPSEALHRSL
ncbi:MAG: ABC transporter permease [Proteobacteria bacterium]|jgi:ABC-type lipoprotein release transport system permease subunit|nr:ABC transporter permease [Pseudomonadota bacterium]MDA1300051.1 ABC transporter permease [Pseudomonadota bacterium]